MNKIAAYFLWLSFWPVTFQAQVGIGTMSPSASSVLEVASTTKGVLFPRMTAVQRASIDSPATGLLVYMTDELPGFYYFNGSSWNQVISAFPGIIDFDGNGYATVVIGNQMWMAENLRATHYRNGDAVPNYADNSTWISTSNGAYCWVNNESNNASPYGALYNGYAATDLRNLCPSGWHVASQSDYSNLITCLGGVSVAGGKVKSNLNWNSPNTGATNVSGFAALPAGYRDQSDGGFYGNGTYCGWWSSTQFDDASAWMSYVGSSMMDFYQTTADKNRGLLVRCVKDQ